MPAVVEDLRAPVAVLAAARIGVLVERRAVEQPQAVAVAGEMGRHPVEDHADAVLVQHVDEIHEVLRRAVAAGGGVVAHRLVAPTGRQRMLADRQQFDVRVADLLAVLGQLMGQIAVAQPPRRIVARPLPTAQVDLVERQRLFEPVRLLAGGPSSRRRARRSGSGRPPSRPSAAAPRPRIRTGRPSRTPNRRGESDTCRASPRPAPARTTPRNRWGCASAWDAGGRPSC